MPISDDHYQTIEHEGTVLRVIPMDEHDRRCDVRVASAQGTTPEVLHCHFCGFCYAKADAAAPGPARTDLSAAKPAPLPSTLRPTRGAPHDSESLDGCEGIGWDLSFGFRLNVGHDSAEDPTSPLTIGANFSDSDQARGIVVRETTPEQLEEFARLLLNVAAKHRQRMDTRPNPSAGDAR